MCQHLRADLDIAGIPSDGITCPHHLKTTLWNSAVQDLRSCDCEAETLTIKAIADTVK